MHYLFLFPLTIKLFAFVLSNHTYGVYHQAQSDEPNPVLSTRRYQNPNLGYVAICGTEFYLRQFGRAGSYGNVQFSGDLAAYLIRLASQRQSSR
jgi:hypothetical protein